MVPFLRGEGITKLDGFMVSHNDFDHSGGMASVLALMPVRWLASSFSTKIEAPETHNKISCFAGQVWLWDSVKFEVLHPAMDSYADEKITDNNRSCVLKVTSQAGSILLTGDIEKEAELALLNSVSEQLKSDVLTVPHHGSKTSSIDDFIAAVSPNVSIFTTGYLNRFGHPKPLIVERYQSFGSIMYRSDYDGALVIDYVNNLSNKNKIMLSSWRAQHPHYWQDTYVSELGAME